MCAAEASLQAKRKRILLSLLASGSGAVIATGLYAYHYQKKARKGKGHLKSDGLLGKDRSGQTDASVAKKQGSIKGHKGRKKGKRGNGMFKTILPMLARFVGPKIVVLVGLSILRTLVSSRLAKLQGYLFRAAFLRRVPLFVRNISENIVLCAVAGGLEATAKSWVSAIELQWRGQLTSSLQHKYFRDMMYYKLNYVDRRIEMPDQRICEDVPRLTSGLSELLQEILAAMIDAGFYSVQLKKYSGTHGYTLGVMGYVLGVGTFMTVAAPNFGGMFKKQQHLAGIYRNLHNRLVANSEPICFYNGTEKEGAIIKGAFSNIIDHSKKVLGKQWRFSMVQDFLLKYLGATVAVALIIGPFFGGHLRPEATVLGRAQMLSNMRYHTSVIIALFSALGTFGTCSRKVLKLNAFADRVDEMFEVMKDIASGHCSGAMADAQGRIEASEDSIDFIDATIVTPGDATLVNHLSLNVPAGVNLLVTGPNGAGKSSLFRVLGGLWPLSKGLIRKPGANSEETGLSHDIFYVPQKPYVAVGTLQEQLLYPLSPSDEIHVDDLEMRDLLKSVDLEYLLDREDYIEGVTNWGEVLSLGEQQRLGMARLFFHKPRFAILDECTSGVTVEMEERFCNAVKDMGCTCITISHRPALMAFHDVVLNLDGEGGWTLHQGHRKTSPEMLQRISQKEIVPMISSKKSKGKNRNKEEVEQVLKGMAGQEDGSIELSDGNEGFSEIVIAKAPKSSTQSAIVWKDIYTGPTSVSSNWWSVLRIIFGGNPSDSTLRMLTVSGVVILRTLLQDRIARLNGRSVDLVLRQDLRGFILLIGQSVLQSAASAILAPSLRHVADSLALTWRSRLTRNFESKYLSGYVPYYVSQLQGVKDIDQRITRDAERLSEDLAALVPSLVKPVADIAWFSAQLWRLTGPRGAFILYSYAIIGYGCLRAVTPDFARLLDSQYDKEGAFRGAHERLRSHAESIAFFSGGEREGQQITGLYRNLVSHLKRLINLRWKYGAADDFFAKQLPHSVTWILTLLYALDQREDFGDSSFQGHLVLQIRYLASVVTQCFSAFGELLALPKRFAEISGGINRVSDALRAIERGHTFMLSSEMQNVREQSNRIVFDHVDVVSPSHALMARKLSFSLPEGKSLLITGPNGSGKTSIMRLLAGLWPLGDGRISSPVRGPPGGVFYVSQKPYTTIGTLRDQIIYPLSLSSVLDDRKITIDELDKDLDALMVVVRLRYLIVREGGWDAEKSWSNVLSLGEQQRMGMARMFYHKPIFAVLDDCTNAMSVDVEEAMYKYASEALGINLITIAQRTALLKYHDMELRLKDGKGNWELAKIKAC